MRNWGDAKRFIFEDMCLYGLVLVFDLGYDVFFNLACAGGLLERTRPVGLGVAQCSVAVFFTLLLLRKISQWQYYK